jgi:hypothetical protein
MIITKETTEQELLARFRELGYYMPIARLKGDSVKVATYNSVLKKLRAEGYKDARTFFRMQVLAVKDQEREAYQVAKEYGEV